MAPRPSDTFARLLAQAAELEPGSPDHIAAMAVVLDCAQVEGLVLELGGICAYPGARPSPRVRVTATEIAEGWHPRAAS